MARTLIGERMGPRRLLIGDGCTGYEHMIVGTHLVVAYTVEVVAVVFILPTQTCIDRKVSQLQCIVGKDAPRGGLLLYVVVGRETALSEVTGTVNCGGLFAKGQIANGQWGSDDQFLRNKLVLRSRFAADGCLAVGTSVHFRK